MEIRKSAGLQISEKVLRKIAKTVKDIESEEVDYIYVDTFNNCRETGLCFQIERKGKTLIIWTCQCRNTDQWMLVIAFDRERCNRYNMFDDEAYARCRTYYESYEVKEMLKSIEKLVVEFLSGHYDDEEICND